MKCILPTLALLLSSIVIVNAQTARPTASNWADEAKAYLSKDGKPFDKDVNGAPRCVLMNNYGCVMQGADKWDKSIGQDRPGHAIFSEAAYGVRAMVRDLCSKHKSGYRSALAIIERFSPWCDTNGTVAVKLGWGRTCVDDKPRAPANHPGPKCLKPANGIPTAAQCAACNCPNEAATLLIEGLGIGIDTDLKLFANDGSVNVSAMKAVLRNHFRTETGGYVVADDVLDLGIKLAGSCN